jgi:hypothetical protein
VTIVGRLRRPGTLRPVLVTAGIFGWLTFAALAARAYGDPPHGSGFDLELLIQGGRHVAAGVTPYDPTMLAGRSVEIASLFYSYPPIVAQALAPITFLPSPVIFAAVVVLASLAAVLVGRAVAVVAIFGADPTDPGAADLGRFVGLALAALLPFWFPYTVGMLFGNIDMFFPALYGLVLLAVIQPSGTARSERWVVAAGLALALASITKLHPAVLGLWLLARGLVERRRGADLRLVGPWRLPRSWRIAAVSIVAVALALAFSFAVGGIQPWLDYVTVLRAGAQVNLLDPRNIGPAVQIVMLFGLGPSAVGPIQVVVMVSALAITIVAALAVEDPLESLTWAATASFVVLPVTWFHHFAALVPFGIAALARGSRQGAESIRRLWILVIAAFAVVMIGFAQPPTWLLVPIFLAAARIIRPGRPAALRDPGAPLETRAPA